MMQEGRDKNQAPFSDSALQGPGAYNADDQTNLTCLPTKHQDVAEYNRTATLVLYPPDL